MNSRELIWKNIKLISYERSNFEYIYKCYQDYESRPLFTNNFNIMSRDEFSDYIDKRINHEFHDFMIIIDTITNLPIGFVYTYNFNRQNGYMFFAIYLEENARHSMNVAVTSMIFFNYIFKHYPIRKIYCSLFDYNFISKKVLKIAGFQLEGCLKQYRYFNREYHDMNIYALFRDDFYSLMQKLKG